MLGQLRAAANAADVEKNGQKNRNL